MLIEIAVVALTVIPSMIVGELLAKLFNLRKLTHLFRVIVGATVGLAAYSILPISIYVVAATALAPIVVDFSYFLYLHRKQKNRLDGNMGEGVKWEAELLQNGDDKQFKLASIALSEEEKMEARIIADSKSELREVMIERFEELSEDVDIPEKFIQ